MVRLISFILFFFLDLSAHGADLPMRYEIRFETPPENFHFVVSVSARNVTVASNNNLYDAKLKKRIGVGHLVGRLNSLGEPWLESARLLKVKLERISQQEQGLLNEFGLEKPAPEVAFPLHGAKLSLNGININRDSRAAEQFFDSLRNVLAQTDLKAVDHLQINYDDKGQPLSVTGYGKIADTFTSQQREQCLSELQAGLTCKTPLGLLSIE